jgi:hypothetical protein
VLARTGGHRLCWHGQQDIKGAGKDCRTQIVLAGTGGHERCW